jgi:peptidoglycan/xylan/chitin deacetylase (PgdA/CDA1 family)
MKIVILAGSDGASSRWCAERLRRLAGIEIVAVLLDTAVPSGKQRWKNLWRNTKREGARYFFARAAELLDEAITHRIERRILDRREVDQLLQSAFPEESFSWPQWTQRHGIPLHRVGNLNGAAAQECLRQLAPELGVVVGTRILKRATFSLPARGCINLHKGQVPEYRGMPPGFWEIWDGQTTAGVTVHFVDDGLDTGAIVATGAVAIHPQETPVSLRLKLDEAGADVLVRAVTELAQGTAAPRPQPPSNAQTRTKPSRRQIAELAARAPHLAPLRQRPFYQAAKTLYLALVLVTGLWKSPRRRGAILLYHRVTDAAQDVLTVSRRRFAEHLCLLRRFYRVQDSWRLVTALQSGRAPEAGTVAIHFDDCYECVASVAAPLLAAAGLPANSFISSGFIDTDRRFAHDEAKYPQHFPNLSRWQIRELPAQGVTVGAHTVNHADMGAVSAEQARFELEQSRLDLEELMGTPVLQFSFPYGKPKNFRGEYTPLAQAAGFEAVYSAYGGYVTAASDRFNLPRFGVCDDHRPLDLLMEVAGFSPSSLRFAWFGR